MLSGCVAQEGCLEERRKELCTLGLNNETRGSSQGVVAVLGDSGGLVQQGPRWLRGDLQLQQPAGGREAPGEPGEGLSREGFSPLPWPL